MAQTPFHVTTSTALDLAGYTVLVDGQSYLHRSSGITSAFYLLRPDGIVAMRGPGLLKKRLQTSHGLSAKSR